MERSEKEVELTGLKERFSRSAAAILVEYRGLKVSEMTELRRKFTDSGVEFKVVKNRLAKLAMAGTPMEVLAPFLTGPLGIATVDRDPVAPAKILKDFVKANERCKVRSGFLKPDRLLTVAQVDALASVPSKEESLSKLLGSMQAPIRNMACVLAAIPRSLVNVLSAVRDQKEQAA